MGTILQNMGSFWQGLSRKQDSEIMKRDRAGWVLAVLNSLAALNSTYAFLVFMQAGLDSWFFMNICAPVLCFS